MPSMELTPNNVQTISEKVDDDHQLKLTETTGKNKYRQHLKTLLASFSAGLGAISLGTTITYTSPAIPDLNGRKNVFHLNLDEVAWTVSVLYIGCFVGGLSGGFLLDKYGRRLVLVVTSVPFILGWTVIACSQNFYWMLVGRIVTGLSMDIVGVGVITYIAEIAAPSVRGSLGTFNELGANIGYLYTFAFGCFLPWNWLAIACMAFPVLLMCTMMLMPESPRWLLMKGRREECLDVLRYFRGQHDFTEEFLKMEEAIRKSTEEVWWREFTKPNLYKPLLIVSGLMLFQQMSGYVPILGFTVTILDSTGTSWNPYVMTAAIGSVGVLSNMISSAVVDRAGRRVMLFLSSGIMIVSMAGLASFFTIKYFRWIPDMAVLEWLPVLTIMSFNFGMAIGYGPVPYYLGSEMFPLVTRGIAIGVILSSCALFAFISSLAFPYLLASLPNFIVYWILCGISVLGLGYAYVIVPETKGKSLEEIEQEYNKYDSTFL